MRKLILLGAFALPLLGAGVAQADEPVYTPTQGGCSSSPLGVQCNGSVSYPEFFAALGLGALLGSS
jgi:hypothetical protein